MKSKEDERVLDVIVTFEKVPSPRGGGFMWDDVAFATADGVALRRWQGTRGVLEDPKTGERFSITERNEPSE